MIIVVQQQKMTTFYNGHNPSIRYAVVFVDCVFVKSDENAVPPAAATSPAAKLLPPPPPLALLNNNIRSPLEVIPKLAPKNYILLY